MLNVPAMFSNNPYAKMMKDMPFFADKDKVAHERYIAHILYRFSELQTEAMDRPIELHEYEDELSYLLDENCWKTKLFAQRFVDAFKEPDPARRYEIMNTALRALKRQFSPIQN